MSFSVKASEYTPAACDFNDSAAATGTKQCICIAFYKTGECPYGNFCEHAHHFTELQADAKSNFLTNVPFPEIAPHFVGLSPKGTDMSTFTSAGMTPEWFSGASANETPSFRSVSPLIKGVIPSFTTNAAGLGDYVGNSQSQPQPLLNLQQGVRVRGAHTNAAAQYHSGLPGDVLAYSPHSHKGTDGSSTSSSTRSSHYMPSSSMNANTNTNTARPSNTERPRRQGALLPSDCQHPHRLFRGTYYDVLGLTPNATHKEIIAQYRHWHVEGFRRLHDEDPELAEKQDCLIVEARNVLGNVNMRREYDEHLRESGALD